MPASPLPTDQARGNRRTAAWLAGLALGMVGLAYASVPLYDLFCRMTGFDGTPLVGKSAPAQALERSIPVRFDANVAPGLPWRFTAEVPQIEARLGETKTVFFQVRNTGKSATTGISTFNVQPSLAGGFFVKIQCFCFNEQTLQPGETMDFPVVFYVDPALADDPSVKDLNQITLSYTYFPAKGQGALATAGPAAGKPNL